MAVPGHPAAEPPAPRPPRPPRLPPPPPPPLLLLLLLLPCLLLLAPAALANPLRDPNVCGRPTCVGGPKFAYAPHTRYDYSYSLNTSALFQGTSRNESTLRVTARVSLLFLSSCEGELKVSDVALWEGWVANGRRREIRGTQRFEADVSEFPLRFSFHDGIISELCPAANETSWVLNLKRGILSTFQNSMRRFDVSHKAVEADVHGECETHYSLDRVSGTSLILNKTKDFSTCISRNKFHSILQTTPYVFHSAQHGVPVVRSRGSCDLWVDHNVYSRIGCSEAHIFQPFSNGSSGATTRVRQALELLQEEAEPADTSEPVDRRVPLLFDHDLTPKPTSGELRASRDLLRTMCVLHDGDVQPQFPHAFAHFLRTARLLSSSALTQLYLRAPALCRTARQHLLSALPLLGSNAAVALMRDLILRGAVDRSLAHDWLFAVAFIPRPDLRTVALLSPLLRNRSADAQQVLAVSSVVRSYCRWNPSCADQRPVYEIMEHLLRVLRDAMSARVWTRQPLEKAVVAVKALANVGLASDSLRTTLRRCLADPGVPLELRLACIDAHRRLPCEDTRPFFLELFRNQTADPELRIAAYLQVMRCPNYNVIKTIKHTLEVEEVNQVGSFVWTHLNNLLKSSIPSRVELQGLLQQRDLEKKFSSDARKFSHNFQGSVFFDEYNAGGNYDSNVIFSPKSYIPRSGMLNLTVDLFGESINVFEVSGRLEGFEHYLESIFGPRGPLSSRKVNDKLEDALKRVRLARDVNNNLVDQVDSIPNVIDNNFNHPKASLGLKVFGNELRYHTLDGEDEVADALNKVNPVRLLQQLLSGQEINYNKATMFMDADYVVPTGGGLPLSLNAFGTAAVSLKMSGSLKGSNFLQTGELDVTGNIRPSVAVNVVGTMGVDAYYSSAGIRLKTNLYTSSAVDAQLKVRGKRLVSLAFNLPKDKMEIVTAESELLVLAGAGAVELPQRGDARGRVERRFCSWPALDQTLGLNFCADLQFPNASHRADAPGFLLNGPTRFSLAFQKADLTANKYLLEYKWETTQTNSSVVSLVFDTPGSAQKRELSARLHLDNNTNNLTLLIQSAKVKYEALGRYKNTEGDKHILFELNINEKKHVDMELSLKTEKITNGFKYLPRLYLEINSTGIAELSGTLQLIEKKGVSQCDVNLEFKTRKLESQLTGYVKRGEATVQLYLKLNYKFQNATDETVTLDASFTHRHSKSYTRAEGEIKIISSAYPKYNFKSSLHYQSSNGHFECLFEINYGLNIDDIRNKFTLSMEFTFAKSYDTTKINLAVRVTKPITDINLQFTVSYLSSGPETNVRSIIRYATGKDIHITLDLKIPRSALTFIEAKLNVTLPTFHPMVLDLQLHEKTPNEYNIDVTATWFSGHTVTAKGLYQDKSTHKASSHNVKLLLKSPSFEEIAASYKYLRDETELKVELTADHAKDKYYIILKHANPQPSDYETSIELRIKSQVYSLLTVVSLLEHRQITAQLHIDRIRDIHFMLRSLNQPDRKEASMEVKWDANRDPSQKVAVAVQYLHPESMNYSGYVMVSYPGRTIRGNYLFALKDSRCESSAHLEWSPRDSIQITVGAIYEYEDILMLALKSELLTPFESWKRTSLSAGIRHHDNLVQANASVYWHDDQNVALNLYGDYMLSDEEFSCELNASIISTIPQVSSMSGSFSHKQSNNKYDTLLYVQHYPQKAISIKSTWQLEEDENSSNLTGVVNLQSPYPGYNEGMMRCRMHVNSAWDVKGAADLIIDRRKYTFQINGYVKKLTDNMLVFEITTPMENYSKITGRFGYSGERKHLVAEISSPHAQIGIEILFQFQNTNNFDIKFNVATPIEFLQKAILVAKLEEETVDFRCGWNNLTIGFFGQWHYENITDFEYCYKIFTPLEGFHENGVIAKLIKHEGLDFSLGFNVGDKKLGLKVYGASNPAPPPDLKLATKQLYDDEAYDDEDEELINWKGSIEVDTFFHPTLKGTLEIEEKDTTYIVASTLTLPNGTAVLLDELDFEDVFTISNKFHLKTPYPQFEEIHSTYDYKIDLGVQFKTAVYVAVLHNKQWKEAGASVNYTYDGEDDSALQTWTASVNIFSPFDLLKFYLVQGVLEVEGTVYRTNVTMSTSDSRLTSTGFLQADEDYFESALSFGMVSPVYTIPSLRISGKRDFTQPEKRIELMLESLHPLAEMYKFQGHWNLQSRQNFGLGMTLNTPYESMPSATFGVAYRMANDNSSTQLNIILSPLPQHTWKLDSIVIGDQISTDLETPIENYSKLALNGTLTSDKENSYTIKGTLKCENRIYTVDGSTSANAESPLQAELTLADQNDGSVILIHANIKPVENGFNLSCGMQNGKENFDLQGHLRMKNLLDFNYFVKATSTHATYSLIYFDGTVFQISDGNITAIFNADTSLPGYRKIRFFSNISLKEQAGALKTSLETETVNTRFNLEWALKLFENILLAFDGHYQDPEITKSGTLKVFFAFPRGKGKNPRKDVSLGAYVNLDKDAWLFGSNATLSFSTSIEDIDVQAHVILPPPRYDIHSFQGQMHFNEKFDDLKFLAKYKTAITKKNYGLSSRYLVKNDNINGNVQMEFGPGQLDYINNVFNVRRDNTTVEGTYVLTTPLYEENTLRATALYKVLPEFNIVRAQLFYPESQNVSKVMVDFRDFGNMNGTLISNTPLENLPYAGVHFRAATKNIHHERFAEVFWPNNTALFDSKYVYQRTTSTFTTELKGSLLVEIPLATRHTGKINYNYMEKSLNKTGHASIEYNDNQLLEGNYKCVSESSAGREKDKIEIDLENEYFPLGIFYTHENRYSGGNEGTNLPTIDIKHAEVFKLNNMTAFHLTGELKIKTTHSGQDILMTAKHLKRVVTLQTDYDQKDNEFTHRSMLTLDPDSWASYDITIVNKTTDEKDEEHIDLNFAYPQRNFTVSGYYQLANNSLSSEMKFVWDKETRSVGTSLDWKRLSYKPNKQHAVFSIKHPSFIRDITLNGIYYSDDKDLINVSTDLVYSNDARKKLSLSGKIQDISQGRNKKYQYQILGSHPATRLDLNAYGGIILERGFYKTNNKASYGRSYLSTQTGELNGMVNTHEKEIDFEKKTPGSSTHLKGKFTGKYPVYRVNGTTSRGRLLNSTGDFYVHFEDKIFLVSVNTTQDGSDRYYYMDGNIPDSRNALFNVWTDYEDIRVNDVVFYLRLNHSRLVTSKLRWRPELETEIRDYVDTFGKEVWNGFFANAEYWKNYIRSEINDSVQDIWKDAQPIIQGFLDDVEELNSLKDDFEKFKIYLNDSYNNNDFYVQDIVGFCNKLVDDLAIRAHIESLPAFVKEIWDIMGESGEAILKSLRWIIDTIKNSFQKAVDFINSLMRGDLTSKISDLMTKLVEKYDKFIKDLHVAFVKYMSDLWHKTSALLTEHWNNFVLTVEPTFVMIAHYVETIVWNVSTEVLDFLYQRKTELVESPYFSKFANFTQDLDKFYKDIMKNDIITNIRKYSKIVYEFIRDKYFAMVPFGKELEDIANEIISELKVLQKLPSINYAIEKSNELYEKIVWVYNYLDLGTRIQKAITLVHLKITDITQTALQAENRYREAKTLFIFDPDNGLVILEQKLPMSWHAFNETPRFEEIPEYKAINDLQNYFVSSNITFWTLYYEYKPYTEPSNWLPPFSGQAIIAGPQHFMTFDRSFYEFQGSCSYLLASDFVDRNFSLAISYDVKNGEHVISVIIGKEIIHIDIFNDEVTIEKGENKMLPIEIGDTFIYQEASIVTVESEKGFKIQCNMKFDVCVISLSGWYFGKTAGLLGTMDNEPTSDFLTPQKILEKDIGKFAQSWALNRETCSSTKNFAVMKQTPEDALVTKCNEFFKMKSSQFSSCFSRVDSTPFLNMCLNSRDSADKDPCTVAVAYMQACTIENTPLRIPESCVKCRILVPDMEVPEGDFRQLEGNEVPKSTDVVFIVEAGSCNSNITTERSLDALLTSLSKELTGAGFTSNRYSVVVFGGDGVYNQPRSVVLNNNVFTTPEEILQYFENIPTGSGDKDIFGAIRFAAQLVFRPGVSKTFILIPCSNCNPGNMTLDYSVLHQVLLERGIQLHILMNDEFRFQKQKAQKNFYGMDRDNAYTNKDIKDLKGDSDLKRQVLLPKSKLGVCTALALETNGTVFTAKRLQGDKKNVVKKFVTVFAKRVAQTADPYPCQKCECTADNNGISYMECFPCEYPQPSQYNYNFDEDLDISAISAIADEEEADYLDEDI